MAEMTVVVCVDRAGVPCSYQVYAKSFCGHCNHVVQFDRPTADAVLAGAYPLCLVCAHGDMLPHLTSDTLIGTV